MAIKGATLTKQDLDRLNKYQFEVDGFPLTTTTFVFTAGTSFVVTSTLALDTSTFNWLIIN